MAATVPTKEPVTHQAGDSFRFTKSLSDYSAQDWVLTYELRARSNADAISIIAMADGDDFTVESLPAVTADWKAGMYAMIGYVSDGTDRFTIYRGTIEITSNVAEEDQVDLRSYWERVRDKLQDVIENGVIREVIRYTYNGVSTEVQTMDDAFKALAYAESKVAAEKMASKPQRIYTKFVKAR